MYSVKYVDWNDQKNTWLKKERGVCFEDVILAIIGENLLATIKNKGVKYQHQQIFIVKINNYAYLVPFVEDTEKVFLKTIIPNHQATLVYIIKSLK